MTLRQALAKFKRWRSSRKSKLIFTLIVILCVSLVYIIVVSRSEVKYLEPDFNYTRQLIEKALEEEVRMNKGSGCDIPKLDPFDKEIMQFYETKPKVVCPGQDWVKCYFSKCKPVPEILKSMKNLVCLYQDILYKSDAEYVFSEPVTVNGAGQYTLIDSDHVKIQCTAKPNDHFSIFPIKWVGFSAGFRTNVENIPALPSREYTDVLVFLFDSSSKIGFIRKMPKTYEYLTKTMEMVVLNGYNIVGDGTIAALLPILTGRTELELPDVRVAVNNTGTLDSFPFIFKRLKKDGYRTAYFEDMPGRGTFQYRFHGFKTQPADHYLQAFFLEQSSYEKEKYCVGDTPRYKMMMNITDQFLSLDGKKFCFTFIGDISHDDFNMISTADDDMVEFLKIFEDKERRENTLLIVMGDHGPRYSTELRQTLQGKLEERLPLMAISLPEELRRRRPEAVDALLANADALTTPHDIHATLMDVLGFAQDGYTVPGADLPRAMTLLKPIPRNRSCGEAGIEPHWCSCLSWQPVPLADPICQKSANAFVGFINSLTSHLLPHCVPRTLTSIEWVMRQKPNSKVLEFEKVDDDNRYIGKFGKQTTVLTERYQIKVVVGPGRAIFEASLTYLVKEDQFHINTRDISRTNLYGSEPNCILGKYPQLYFFCYCKNMLTPELLAEFEDSFFY